MIIDSSEAGCSQRPTDIKTGYEASYKGNERLINEIFTVIMKNRSSWKENIQSLIIELAAPKVRL